MEKIIGANLGNWLVLEKWMQPSMFEGTGAEDETWLNRKMSGQALADKMKEHRDTWITEKDFAYMESKGINAVRLPVPYFVFGDYPPYIGCIEYVDKAMAWAQMHHIKVLIDLHTTPGSQNGYDNGGLTGVCKWCRDKEGVKYCLKVLTRLARRYGHHEALFGIEVVNEPISWIVYVTAPSTGKAVDKEEAKGSSYVPMSFLRKFYKAAYTHMRKYMPEDKAIVFHDGFRLRSWDKFFKENNFKNVYLDTHIYIFAMENFVPIRAPWVYRIYMQIDKMRIRKTQRYIPVIVGEWCISTHYANFTPKGKLSDEEYVTKRKNRYRAIAKIELDAWEETAGWFYWNYKQEPDPDDAKEMKWKEAWDLSRCLNYGWMPEIESSGKNL